MKKLFLIFILSFIAIDSAQAQCTEAPDRSFSVNAVYCNSFAYLEGIHSFGNPDSTTWFYYELYDVNDTDFSNPIEADSTQDLELNFGDSIKFAYNTNNLILMYATNPCGSSDTTFFNGFKSPGFLFNNDIENCNTTTYTIDGNTSPCLSSRDNKYQIKGGDINDQLQHTPYFNDTIIWELNGVEYYGNQQDFTFTLPEFTQEVNTLRVTTSSECSCNDLENSIGNRNEIAQLTIIAQDCMAIPCTEAPIIDTTNNPDFFVESIGTCNDIDNELYFISRDMAFENSSKIGSYNMVIELYAASDVNFSNVLSSNSFSNYNNINEQVKVNLLESEDTYKARLYFENDCGISASYYSNIINESPIFDVDVDTCSNHINIIEGEDYFCDNFSNTNYTLQGDNLMRNNLNYTLRWYLNNIKIPGSNKTVTLNNLQQGDNILEARINTPCNCEVLDYSNNSEQILAQKDIFVDTNCFDISLSGFVYGIADEDCLNPNKTVLKNVLVEINNGLFRTLTDSNGRYSFTLPLGDYTINAFSPSKNDDVCSVDSLITLANDTTVNLDISMNENANIFYYIRRRPRPGSESDGFIYLQNTSSQDINNARVNITVEGPVSGITTAPSWASINANTYSINGVNINAQTTFPIYLNFTVDSTANIGDIIRLETELVTSRSIFRESTTRAIRNSYDPNDKQVNKQKVDITEIDEKLQYTIRFQNTGNAPALNVVVTDTLDADLLDIGSIQIGAASHPFEVNFTDNNVLVWTFNDINLPDSTSDLEGSQGFLTFSINMIKDVQLGDEILNSANIYFDFNPPIITNKANTKILNLTGISENAFSNISLYPNPSTGMVNIKSESVISKATIYNLQGLKVLEYKAKELVQLDLSTLSAGVYHIQLSNVNQQSVVKRIIKN